MTLTTPISLNKSDKPFISALRDTSILTPTSGATPSPMHSAVFDRLTDHTKYAKYVFP
jgi:hypothetical protein